MAFSSSVPDAFDCLVAERVLAFQRRDLAAKYRELRLYLNRPSMRGSYIETAEVGSIWQPPTSVVRKLSFPRLAGDESSVEELSRDCHGMGSCYDSDEDDDVFEILDEETLMIGSLHLDDDDDDFEVLNEETFMVGCEDLSNLDFEPDLGDLVPVLSSTPMWVTPVHPTQDLDLVGREKGDDYWFLRNIWGFLKVLVPTWLMRFFNR